MNHAGVDAALTRQGYDPPTMPAHRKLAALCATVLLASCGEAYAPEPFDRTDPMVSAALTDPLLTDPDLNSRNPAGEGLYGAGPPDGSLPMLDASPEAAARAREEATRVLGGSPAKAPIAVRAKDPGPVTGLLLMADRLPGAKGCTAGLDWSAIWAARLAPELSVFPRAHVTDSTGADGPNCALRIVRFATPVAPGEVIDFYHSRLKRIGHGLRHRTLDDGSVLSGGKPGLRWRIEARSDSDGLADIVLITLADRES